MVWYCWKLYSKWLVKSTSDSTVRLFAEYYSTVWKRVVWAHSEPANQHSPYTCCLAESNVSTNQRRASSHLRDYFISFSHLKLENAFGLDFDLMNRNLHHCQEENLLSPVLPAQRKNMKSTKEERAEKIKVRENDLKKFISNSNFIQY